MTWRAQRYRVVPEESVQCWNLFLCPPPPAMLLFHISSDQWWQYGKCFWKFSLILQNWTMIMKRIFYSPEFNRSIIVPRLISISKKIDQFLRHWIIGERIFLWFNISPSSLPKTYGSCGWAGRIASLWFCFAFDRLAKSPAFNFNAYSSNCISEVSCSLSSWSLLFKFVINLFKPWEILTHEWTDLILISTHINRVGNRLLLPIRARFWCSLWSNLLVQMNLRLLARCPHDRPLNLWIVRIFQCLSSWNTVRL